MPGKDAGASAQTAQTQAPTSAGAGKGGGAVDKSAYTPSYPTSYGAGRYVSGSTPAVSAYPMTTPPVTAAPAPNPSVFAGTRHEGWQPPGGVYGQGGYQFPAPITPQVVAQQKQTAWDLAVAAQKAKEAEAEKMYGSIYGPTYG